MGGYSCPCALCSPHGPESEVCVHQGVDEVVHRHEPSSAGGELAEAVEDIHEHRQVVIPMEKYQLLFPQDDEHGVPQLWHLGQGEEPSPEAAHFVLLHEARVADGVVEAAGGEGVQELGEDSRKAADAEDGEERAPGGERSSELVGRPGGHPGLPGEDEDDVDGAGPRCHRHPVLLHPPLRLPLVEALLEVEDVRVDRVVADQRLQRLQGGKLGPHCFLLQQVHLHPKKYPQSLVDPPPAR